MTIRLPIGGHYRGLMSVALSVVLLTLYAASSAQIRGDTLKEMGMPTTKAIGSRWVPEELQLCATCHREVVRDYLDHGMYNTLGIPGEVQAGEVENSSIGAKYRLGAADGRVILDLVRDGQVARRQEIVGRIGSGKLAASYVGAEMVPGSEEVTDRLFFAPVELIAGDGLELAPFEGHSKPGSLGIPLSGSCLTCHTDTPLDGLPGVAQGHTASPAVPFPKNHLGRTSFSHLQPPGCDSCHVNLGDHPDSLLAQQDESTAPARPERMGELAPLDQLDRCARCHLQGDVRIELVDKQELDWTKRLIHQIPVLTTAGAEDDFRFVGQVERLAQSACFNGSPEMTCTTCHDPHKSAARQGLDDFNRRCLGCHSSSGVSEHSEVGGVAELQNANCVGCHVRKSQPFDLPHVQSADHFIRARIPEPESGIPHRQFADPQGDLKLFSIRESVEGIDPQWLRGVTAIGLVSMGRAEEALELFNTFPAPGSLSGGQSGEEESGTGIEAHEVFHTSRALAYAASARLPEAEAAFSDALSLSSLSAEALIGRATIRLDLGDIRGMLEDTDKLIRHYPDAEAPWALRLQLAERVGRSDLAYEALLHSLNIWPANHSHREKFSRLRSIRSRDESNAGTSVE